MYYFIVETLTGNKKIEKETFGEIKKEYDLYLDYKKTCLSISEIKKIKNF